MGRDDEEDCVSGIVAMARDRAMHGTDLVHDRRDFRLGVHKLFNVVLAKVCTAKADVSYIFLDAASRNEVSESVHSLETPKLRIFPSLTNSVKVAHVLRRKSRPPSGAWRSTRLERSDH